MRLETLSQFQIQMPLTDIIHSTRMIQKDQNNDDAIRKGQHFLAGNEDFPRSAEILRNLKIETVEEDNYLSFSDRSQECYQTSIVSSITNVHQITHKQFQNFFNENLQNYIQGHHESVEQSSIAVPVNQIEGKVLEGTKMELTSSANSFIIALTSNPNDILEGFLETVSSPLFSYLGELQKPYCDIFIILNTLRKYPSDIIAGSLEFLEEKAKRFIQIEVNSNLSKAKRGGTIGIIQTIQGYLNIQRHKFYQSSWAVIYYALRCGEINSALEYANAHSTDFDNDVILALKLRSMGHELDESRYNSLVSSLNREATLVTQDPFKILSLAVLTGSRIIPSNDVINTIEDWLWLMLHLNPDLNSISNEFHEKNVVFSDSSNPFLHGQILLLIGQFEEAAEIFLNDSNNIQCNLHSVLIMHITKFISSKLLYNNIKSPLLDYAKKLFKASPLNSIRYLSYIDSSADRIKAISDLIIEVDNGEIIFNSQTEMSYISQILIYSEQNLVLETAAKESELQDQLTKSSKFYRLIPDYSSVIRIECKKLCQYIQGFINNDIVPNIILTYNEMSKYQIDINPQLFEDFRALLRIGCAFRLFNVDKIDAYQKALNEIEASELIPLSKLRVKEFTERLKHRNDFVKNVLPATIIMNMKALVKVNSLEKNMAEGIKERSDALMAFAGMLEMPTKMQKELLDLQLEFVWE
ncbi:nuclear pore complex protein [Histomonas meleagridis]|uniref:nuclear pore complex protein Nup93-like n=1 Tax=Histomonas meleagridis TaxID=135588 RepID=UPI003559D5DC|nr:nuclear pore complex protein [Histomonas meleagridis]KAH0805759.1 nuclear pore complex protein Nup93-like [Histomonas meleagridis]